MKKVEKKQSDNSGFFVDITSLIEQSRQNVATTVNAEITLLYWNIGGRINKEILKNTKAEYGKQIIATLPNDLTQNLVSDGVRDNCITA